MDPKGEQTAFVYTTYIQQTPERVWQGLTDPALMKRYCATSQAAYSSIVAPNPSGRTPSNPGSHRATLSGTAERSQQAAPDGGGLGHSVDEDGGHGLILSQRTRRPPRQRSRPSAATRANDAG